MSPSEWFSYYRKCVPPPDWTDADQKAFEQYWRREMALQFQRERDDATNRQLRSRSAGSRDSGADSRTWGRYSKQGNDSIPEVDQESVRDHGRGRRDVDKISNNEQSSLDF